MSRQVDNKKTKQIRIAADLHQQLKVKAAVTHKTIGRLIEEKFGYQQTLQDLYEYKKRTGRKI